MTTLVVGSFAYYQMQGKEDHYSTVINQLVSWSCLLVSKHHLKFIKDQHLNKTILDYVLHNHYCWFWLLESLGWTSTILVLPPESGFQRGIFYDLWHNFVDNCDYQVFVPLCLEENESDAWWLHCSFCHLSLNFDFFPFGSDQVLGTWKTSLEYNHLHWCSLALLWKSWKSVCSGNIFDDNLTIFLTNVCLIIPIYIKRRQNEGVDQKHVSASKRDNLPKSLESLILNLIIIVVLLAGIFVIEVLNK